MIKFSTLIKEQVEENRYPLYLEERNKKWIDLLYDSLANKKIWNVDFNEAKFALSRNFEKIGSFHLDDFTKSTAEYAGIPEQEVFRVWYEISKTLQTFQSINKLIRIFEARKTSKVAQKYLEVYKSWKVVKDLFDSLKEYVVKGRKVDPSKVKQVYQPPPQASKSLEIISSLLTDITNNIRKELVVSGFNNYIRQCKYYLENRSPNQTPYKFFAPNPAHQDVSKLLLAHIDKTTLVYNRPGFEDYKITDKTKELAQKMAERDADDICQQFILKNTRKLTSIVGEKSKISQLIDASIIDIDANKGLLEGWMKFQFDDGSGFDVQNQIVYGNSKTGRFFVRFPTTFHKVKMSNGTIRALVSEEEMNELWAKE
jgi:hypothetical protein